ncbi:hypothetical protein KR084_006031, partial [Drosophila pseudotakahashii]
MHSTKPALLLFALAIGASCVVASTPPPVVRGDLFETLNRTSQSIIGGFVNATRNGTAIIVDFLDTLQNSTNQYTHETVAFAQKIAEAVHKAATDGLAEFAYALQSAIERLHGQIDRVRNVLQRNALKDALAKLQEINAASNDLELAINNLNDRLEEKKREYLAEIQVRWTNWADAQLERVDRATNGSGNEQAQEILDELLNRYTGYLHSCLEELQVRQATYEQNVQQTIEKYHNATIKLTAQIELCVRNPLNFLSCRNGIQKALQALDPAPKELLSLNLEGIRLLAIGLNASGCVGQTLAQHQLEKPSVERELDDIIKEYLDQRNSTDDDSTSDEEKTTTEN